MNYYNNIILKLASILVFFIILTDNFEKIGLIQVLKVAIKMQLIRELCIQAVKNQTTKKLNFNYFFIITMNIF